MKATGARLCRPDPEWRLLLFSIPEYRRDRCHLLRSRLTWLGPGRVGSAAWIAPAHIVAEVRLTVDELGVEEHVELFTARHLGVRATPGAVARWWDLDAIAEEYRGYLVAWTPRLQVWRAGSGGDPPAAFADRLLQLDAWRRIPFHDPGLPAARAAGWLARQRGVGAVRRAHGPPARPALEHVEGSVAHGDAAPPSDAGRQSASRVTLDLRSCPNSLRRDWTRRERWSTRRLMSSAHPT